jgi:hypothetical protein
VAEPPTPFAGVPRELRRSIDDKPAGQRRAEPGPIVASHVRA